MASNLLEKAVLYQRWGGLGDNLQFSTLPRRFSENGIDTFISRKNAVRNDEIKKLVWDLNPFVNNCESDDPPNCGMESTALTKTKRQALESARNIIEWQEIRHGFDPKSLLPEIGYSPQIIPDLGDTVVLDLGAISGFKHNKYDMGALIRNIDNILKENQNYKIVLIKNEYNKGHLDDRYSSIEILETRDIFHYADVIKSCKKFVCLLSGSVVLASCVRKENTLCVSPVHTADKHFYPTSWTFPTVQYMLASGEMLSDHPDWEKNYRNQQHEEHQK